MAAAKTSLALFLFALIAISANLQMVSADITCSTGLLLDLKLGLLNGIICTPASTYCADVCKDNCLLKFNTGVIASACVPNLSLFIKKMASAVELRCATSLLKIDFTGCPSIEDCAVVCHYECLAEFNVDAVASACVANGVRFLAKSCTCCCAKV
ncbi:hypothetical protein MKX01_026881 [Papaver californicum]|nr:hypothetical protein MKX01_026881 [Papaver californicum]